MTGLTPLQWLLAACALVPAGTALACRLRPGWFRPWMALPGLPAAGLAALLFAMEWPRLLYGGASPLRLALDGTSRCRAPRSRFRCARSARTPQGGRGAPAGRR